MAKSVCIFCGANSGNSKIIEKQAVELCQILAQEGYNLVYGGGKTGLMGLVAETFLSNGRDVVGIRPEKLIESEDVHNGLTQLLIVKTMQERKAKMIELSDCFIALPGGTGTLDEIIETFSLFKIGFIQKPSAILNTQQFYYGLIQLLEDMVEGGFLKSEDKNRLIITESPMELANQLKPFLT